MTPAPPMLDAGSTLAALIQVVASVLTVIIIVYIVTDLAINFVRGVPSVVHDVHRTLGRLCEPVFSQIRRVVPVIAGIDFSPLIALILLEVLTNVITSLLG
jgi:YggT family protein